MKIIRINAMWCPGCLVSKGIWTEIEQKYPENEYVDYDLDLDEEEVLKYNVGETVPVVIIEKNNQELTRLIGEKTKKEIIEVMENLI